MTRSYLPAAETKCRTKACNAQPRPEFAYCDACLDSQRQRRRNNAGHAVEGAVTKGGLEARIGWRATVVPRNICPAHPDRDNDANPYRGHHLICEFADAAYIERCKYCGEIVRRGDTLAEPPNIAGG